MARLTRVRRAIALATRHRVGGLYEGVHSSLHAGRSMEFNDLREYVRGDDVAEIDWKASARSGGSLLVKRHVAERRTTVMVAVATGRSLAGMASPTETKLDVAIQVAGAFGSLATQHGDYVGLIWCDGHDIRAARPSTRDVELERMLGHIEAASTADRPEGDLGRLLEVTATTLRRRGIVVLVCDDVDIDADLESRLRRLVVQHEVMVITLADLDPTDPAIADSPVVGLDDQRELLKELRRDPRLREAIEADRTERAARRTTALSRLAISSLHLSGTDGLVPAVLSLVRSHRHAR
ncbi:DUF58 domain-containing protein [Tessaracoccus antarcticus]|uniref:DUF58 domain-containing protein n=1 Tax=Tessaracoccus antarcticus TaxID=2479848 RepID=A0A3M0GBC6_9ACTN|nr:DUF58 domain-containing protein [Tessaracoccus antarcticus]RMB58339.1 DUF58 domain-containing protein [Tessaracoccus antarcticus]